MKLRLFGWFISIERFDEKERRAQGHRTAYESGLITPIQAVKNVRGVFLDTTDERVTLKGALEYVRRNRPIEFK